jgi:hypothetical protein
MATLRLGIDANGKLSYLRNRSENIYSGLLAANTEQTLTIPTDIETTSGLWDVVFSIQPGTSVWIAINSTAAVPITTVGTAVSELNPVGYTRLKAGDVLHFITADTSVLFGVSLYAIQ